MKILHLINNLGSGGAEKLLEDLIPFFNKIKNVEADILLLTDKNNVFYKSLISKGVKIDIIKYRNIYNPRNIFEIKKYIISGGYDIVHSHIFPTQYWVALSKLFIKNKNVKFITTEHSTHNRRRDKFFFRPIDKLIYSKYDSIISITEKTRSNLINWIDPKHEKMDKYFVIENGVDIEKIKEALPYKKNELIQGISEDVKLVCMVGRFSEAKDQPTLIKAISKLPEDIHLVLVGEGPLMLDNERLADELGISYRVHFLGFRQDVFRILKTIDIVVLSSNWEGFGLAAVEGMASGKPLIASDVSGLREVVSEASMLFERGNILRLVEMINYLFKDDKNYKYITKLSLDRSKIFSISIMANKILKIYNMTYD